MRVDYASPRGLLSVKDQNYLIYYCFLVWYNPPLPYPSINFDNIFRKIERLDQFQDTRIINSAYNFNLLIFTCKLQRSIWLVWEPPGHLRTLCCTRSTCYTYTPQSKQCTHPLIIITLKRSQCVYGVHVVRVPRTLRDLIIVHNFSISIHKVFTVVYTVCVLHLQSAILTVYCTLYTPSQYQYTEMFTFVYTYTRIR